MEKGFLRGLFGRKAPDAPQQPGQQTQILDRAVRPAAAYQEFYDAKGFIRVYRKEGGIPGILKQLRSMPEGSLVTSSGDVTSIQETINRIEFVMVKGVMTEEDSRLITSTGGLRAAVEEALSEKAAQARIESRRAQIHGAPPPDLSAFPGMRPLHEVAPPPAPAPARPPEAPKAAAPESEGGAEIDIMFNTLLDLVRKKSNNEEILSEMQRLARHDRVTLERVVTIASSAADSAVRQFRRQFLSASPEELRQLSVVARLWQERKK